MTQRCSIQRPRRLSGFDSASMRFHPSMALLISGATRNCPMGLPTVRVCSSISQGTQGMTSFAHSWDRKLLGTVGCRLRASRSLAHRSTDSGHSARVGAGDEPGARRAAQGTALVSLDGRRTQLCALHGIRRRAQGLPRFRAHEAGVLACQQQQALTLGQRWGLRRHRDDADVFAREVDELRLVLHLAGVQLEQRALLGDAPEVVAAAADLLRLAVAAAHGHEFEFEVLGHGGRRRMRCPPDCARPHARAGVGTQGPAKWTDGRADRHGSCGIVNPWPPCGRRCRNRRRARSPGASRLLSLRRSGAAARGRSGRRDG